MSVLGSSLLYLLAVDAVACAVLAWGRPTLPRLVAWAIALAVAQGVGERLGASFASIEAKRRERMGTFLGTIQLSVMMLALVLASGSPTPRLLGFLADVLCGYMLLVLLLLRLAPHARGVVGHSLALMALVAVRGGPLAAWSSGSTLALVGLYVGLDHRARLLAAHRLDEGRDAGRALLETAVLVLPVALAVSLAVTVASPEARPGPAPEVADDRYRPLEEQEARELDTRALRAMLVTALFGAVAVYVVGRWLVRSKKGDPVAIEAPEPLRGRLERIRSEARRASAAPAPPGRRGRVVRAYLELLRGAERAGFPRDPAETPDEFAVALGEPRDPLGSATDAFVGARYGPAEVSEDDASRAERDAAAVVTHLSRRPPRRRREVVKDAEGDGPPHRPGDRPPPRPGRPGD